MHKKDIALNLETYNREQELLDRALDSDKGLTLVFDKTEEATTFRMRCYTLRKLMRLQSKEIYPPDDPLYASSPYDNLIFQYKRGEKAVVIAKSTLPSITAL